MYVHIYTCTYIHIQAERGKSEATTNVSSYAWLL